MASTSLSGLSGSTYTQTFDKTFEMSISDFPLDSRFRVDTLNDIFSPDKLVKPYVGLLVYVADEGKFVKINKLADQIKINPVTKKETCSRKECNCCSRRLGMVCMFS